MPPRSSAEALVGTIVGGRYRVIQLLGSGGTGDVYLAEHTAVRADGKRRIALKVLRAEHRGEPELTRRFRREADAAAIVRHPNVLEVLDPPVEHDGILCFAMELLVGLDLADTLAFARTLGSARAVGIACGAAEGLAAAHAAGVVHRDVKPENIFLVHAADGREAVRLLDFGFAWVKGDETLAAGRAAVGTPEYMAPEQSMAFAARPTADVYSLGVVLYEMLAGRTPFVGRYPAVARDHAELPPPPIRRLNPASVHSPELDAVVARALAKDASSRFASMEELRGALLATPEGRAPFGVSAGTPSV